jgi:peptidoglycan hydrolase-like protein with peptidoglycan-binding domain
MRRAATFTGLALVLCLVAPGATSATSKGATRDDKSTADKVHDKVEGASGKLDGDDKNANRDPVKAAQKALKERGYEVDEPDGKLGPKTHAAVRAFQKAEGLPVTGRLDKDTMTRLRAGKHESATR